MAKYEVKFEFYGRNMKTTIEAKSEDEAKYLIMGRVNFISIKKKEDAKYDLPDGFDTIFRDLLGGKK